MANWKKTGTIGAVILAITYLALNTFEILEGTPARIFKIIAFFCAVYAFLSTLPKGKTGSKIQSILSKSSFTRTLANIRLVVKTDKSSLAHAKERLLEYSEAISEKRTEMIVDSQIFTMRFKISDKFIPGFLEKDKEKDWTKKLNTQFSFITGSSGNGKTFELLTRFNYLLERIKTNQKQNENYLLDAKIPLFIELKSLDRNLDEGWIAEYIQKSASAQNFTAIKLEHLNTILEQNEVVYFFDGLDEVEMSRREQAKNAIFEFATHTGVTVTCRTQVYTELSSSNTETPAEYILHSLTNEKIRSIIKNSNENKGDISAMIEFMDNNPHFSRHLSRPILLNLFIVLFKHLSSKEKAELPFLDATLVIDNMWRHYEDFIARKKLFPDEDVQKMRTYSVWIGKIMHGKSFYIESIQPNWLNRFNKEGQIESLPLLKNLYFLFTRVVASVIVGFALGCIISTPVSLISNSVLGGVIIAIVAGIYNIKLKFTIPTILANILLPVFLTLFLVVGCGLYQGFSVPRSAHDMSTPFFSFTETWPGILLGITLSTIFSYRIILERVRKQYILPVELFRFDWAHAFKWGFFWGVMSGIISGVAAVLVKHTYPKSIFINDWLVPNIYHLSNLFLGHKPEPKQIDILVFSYALILTFMVATMIIFILAGRYRDKHYPTDDAKQSLNFAIKRSIVYALLNAAGIAIFTFAIYSLIMSTFDRWVPYHAISSALGLSILSFLWFGGMEVINHYLLRANLNLRGIAPMNYKRWFQANQDMGIIIPTGYKMRFYHSTLGDYYNRFNVRNNKRVKIKFTVYTDWLFYASMLITGVIFLALPFWLRYHKHIFWNNPYHVRLENAPVKKLNDSIYVVTQNKTVALKSSGVVNVGTFVGWVRSQGTENGYMGIPIWSAYDRTGLEQFAHGSLLWRRKRDGIWSGYEYVSQKARKQMLIIELKKNDTLQFIVNDKEYENNKGTYIVAFKDSTLNVKR